MANEHHHHHHHHAVGGSGCLFKNLIFPTSLLPPHIYLIDQNLNNDVGEDTLCVAVVLGDRLDGGNLINKSW